MKLNVRAFALTCGLVWGFGILAFTWWIIMFDGPTGQQTILGQLYRGYTISAVGSLLGLVWGFFDGLAGGAVFAWLYNFISSRAKTASSA
jgi:hypothetical protein